MQITKMMAHIRKIQAFGLSCDKTTTGMPTDSINATVETILPMHADSANSLERQSERKNFQFHA
jgi:hypothetical protein